MKLLIALLLPALLGGCYVYERPLIPERFYSAAEIDAINAEAECRRIARNLLQVARCGPNERR